MILSTNLRSCGSVFVVRQPTCFENADFPKFYTLVIIGKGSSCKF